MNGVDDIPTYRQHYIEPPTYAYKTDKTAATTYDFPEHPPRKEKKWSFGNLFRRKKKDESSSDDDDHKIFKKKRKPKKPACAFDHIVVPPHSRGSYTVRNGEDGVLSDQSGGFGTYATRPLPRVPDGQGSSLGSADSLDKRSRRDRTKARAVARRDSQRRGSSSDEDSARFRSDESLRQRDGSLSRRSRVARTERYIRRLSKDDESILNREALQRQARENWHFCGSPPPLAKSNECPVYGASGLFTIPVSNGAKEPEPRNCFNIRSLSCDANIHKSPSPESQTEVMHVQLPLGKAKYRLVQGRQPPPPPPPRDPRRLIGEVPKQGDNTFRTRNWHAGYRTASEDHIPTEPKQTLAPRPSSVTHETRCLREPPEKFQYLTEKKPRSRRPIFIQSTDRINSTNYAAPQMFTAQTHVQTKIFLPSVVDMVDHKPSSPIKPPSPFKPITGSVDSIAGELVPDDELKRKSANLEEALDELEAIYKSLHLGDEDLLERAEQREQSIAAKKLFDTESYPLTDSSFAYEPYQARKKKPIRKSQTLDRRNDDMAYRKLNKERSNTIATTQNVAGNVSYLLTSPILSPVEPAKEQQDEPDVTLDDVVYRNLRHANNSLRVADPQPPFGIPIGPIALAPNSDYLHAVPENTHRYNFKQKKIPDIVKDDLAFRNLRKDPNKEPALKPDRNGCKKLRAVRSLSANISTLMQNDRPYKRWEVEDSENEFKKASLTDIADAMEIARQILREKEDKIAATKRAFLSDTEAKYRNNLGSSTETITDCRTNFLREMSSKEDCRTNLLKDMRDDRRLSKDDCRTKFLKEMRDDRGLSKDEKKIRDVLSREGCKTNFLKEGERRSSKEPSFEDMLTALAVEARETSERITNELNNLDEDLGRKKKPEVSEHAKLCEKLRECVVESAEVLASSEELVESIENIPESVANVVTTRGEEEPSYEHLEAMPESRSPFEAELIASFRDLGEDKIDLGKIDLGEDKIPDSRSPFEEHKSKLIATFRDLGEDKSDLREDKIPYSRSPFEEHKSKLIATFRDLGEDRSNLGEDKIDIDDEDKSDLGEDKIGGEECVDCSTYVTTTRLNLDESGGVASYTSNCDLYVSDVDVDPIPPLEGLKSPRLVTSAMKSSAAARASGSTESGESKRDNKTRSSWYGDPVVLAFACSYGVACSYQLASLDVVALLGLLFVIISIAAALMLE